MDDIFKLIGVMVVAWILAGIGIGMLHAAVVWWQVRKGKGNRRG